MIGRKFVQGALAAFAVGFVLSGLWHVLLMADFYEANAAGAGREAPIFWAVGLAYLVVGFIMSYLYPKGYEGGSPISEGLKFGAIIGLLWWLPTNLVFYGTLEGPFTTVLIDGGWHLVEQGLAGVALAMVYGSASQEGS
jgi:hypothetical protein